MFKGQQWNYLNYFKDWFSPVQISKVEFSVFSENQPRRAVAW